MVASPTTPDSISNVIFDEWPDNGSANPGLQPHFSFEEPGAYLVSHATRPHSEHAVQRLHPWRPLSGLLVRTHPKFESVRQ